jgi:excisionase family DNA binding protein
MLKLSQVADRLNCSLSNVYNLVASGKLTVTPTGAGGKGYRVAEAELQRFLDEGSKGRMPIPFSPRSRPSERAIARKTVWF